ncbi:pseudouridine synthase [Deinococcus yavapaiensis]|uniref:Pseudouridine synthase n=1 Tax=Deinococcus yavapaiensis KR-236 TaxID=694435 RepID=A0A318SFS0_9DEIO|nr:pseudouridine synthase [Deinococcus yavapaiensis]PYE56274.1 pseudouridine synthase [Deinococcus yavapaiensis KR-236]
MSERLQKRLARLGVASRRAAEDLIREGRVTVNGIVATLGASVTDADDVRVDGHLLDTPTGQHTTFALYKPKGVVTTAKDELGRAGVLDKMPRVPGLHPVGRLDRDSEGLLLLTTNGDLTLRLTHPRYEHEKQYRAWTDVDLADRDLERLERGVDLDDGRTSPAVVERAAGGLYITLREGRNRQVRRMVEALGADVTRLVRVRFGGLWLGDLRPGEFDELHAEDLSALETIDRASPRWRRAEEDMHARWD